MSFMLLAMMPFGCLLHIFAGSSEDFIVEIATKFKQELGIVQVSERAFTGGEASKS